MGELGVADDQITIDSPRRRARRSDNYAKWEHGPLQNLVRSELVQRNWNVSDLAREMGIRPSLISKWMLGQTVPSIKNLQKLSAALSLNEDSVLALVGLRQEQPEDDPRILHLIAQIRAIDWTDDRYAIIRAALGEMRRRPRPVQDPASSWPQPKELTTAPQSQRALDFATEE